MSHWNYRVVRVPTTDAENPSYYYAIIEAYDDNDGSLTAWIHWDERKLVAESAEDLAGDLQLMKQAFRRPVIDATSLPGYKPSVIDPGT